MTDVIEILLHKSDIEDIEVLIKELKTLFTLAVHDNNDELMERYSNKIKSLRKELDDLYLVKL